MKKIYFIVFTLITLNSVAQQHKVLADKVIAVVGDKIILKSDLENSMIDMQRQGMELPPNAKCLILEQALGIKALMLQAQKDSLPVSEEDIESDIDNRIRSAINQYGSAAEVEKIVGKTIYQFKEDMKESIKEQKLAQAMRNKIVEDVRITPYEVQQYFAKIPTDSLVLYESEVEVGQVVIYPKASPEANDFAAYQLKEYKNQIESGKKDFCTIARNYSEDPGSKDNCGRYEINRNQRDLDPIWLAKAFTLKQGQITNPFKTRFGYHIIQLVERMGDDAVVRHILRVPQITASDVKVVNEKLDSVRAMLIAGTIKFGEAVNKFDNSDVGKFTGGMTPPTTIDQLDKDLVAMLGKLRVGQYSQPTEFTDERGRAGVRIVYLKSKSQPHRENLKDDYNKVAQRALEEKKNSMLEKWFDKKIPTYYIMIDDDHQTCDEMKKWMAGIHK